MRTPLTVLDGLRVDHPCPADWDAMPGDARSRHCPACDRAVHDLSALIVAEATALLYGPVVPCVRFQRHPDGSVATRDRPRRPPGLATRLLLAAASWFGLILTGGCSQEPSRTMGTGRKIDTPHRPAQNPPTADQQADRQ